ncbi:MAG TPA: hypothetical protein VLG15_12920 [Thermoanaerobaculia bacterium]|nr:hypothetical protein [Thermoanaerobaculia bacterium]
MSLLYLHFESDERAGRVQKLARSGAHIIVAEPKWPGFWEIAKREKPMAIGVDFTHAPSHALETADYISKARETRETPMFLLRVPADRVEMVQKRLPQAAIVTEPELAERIGVMEREAVARALEKKEAAAQARRAASAAKQAAKKAAAGGKPVAAAGKAGSKKPKASKPEPAVRKKGAPAKKGAAKARPPKKARPSRSPKKKK